MEGNLDILQLLHNYGGDLECENNVCICIILTDKFLLVDDNTKMTDQSNRKYEHSYNLLNDQIHWMNLHFN